MKKTKILVPAMAVLALGMAAAVTGTVAWFSANNVVTANRMMFKSVTPSSLAISDTLAADGIGNRTSITYEVPENTPAINPCSHWHDQEDATGVYYAVENGEFIDPISGLAALNDDVLNSNPADTTFTQYENIDFMTVTGNQYYIDYTCYIASVGQGLTIGTGGYLRAQPTFTFAAGTHSDTIQASTVDFFVYKDAAFNGDAQSGSVVPGTATYVQGVNASGVDYTAARHATYPGQVAVLGTTEKLTSDILVAGDEIPVASGNEAIMVTMRFYFDGALLKDVNNAFVATNRLDTSDITVNVSFSLNRGTVNNG